jgi:hypothetical protein
LVAEDITSRFLNVVSLFNGAIPLIAVQMRAIQLGDVISILFTKVLDERPIGIEEDEAESERTATDRAYWEARSKKDVVAIADSLLQDVQSFAPGMALKYNRHYIGLAKQDVADLFVLFRPRRDHLIVELRIQRDEKLDQELEECGADAMPYDLRWGRYRIRLTTADLANRRPFILELMKRAWSEAQ